MKSLQRIRFLPSPSNLEINLNVLATHTNLSSIIAGPGIGICNDLPEKSKLNLIILEDVEFENGDPYDLHRFNYYDRYTYEAPIPEKFPEWAESVRLLYGPWGIPNCDLKLNLNEIKCTCKDMPSFNHEAAVDRIIGTIIGAALGSILGSSTKFTRRPYAGFVLETPIDIIWSHMNDDANTNNIKPIVGTILIIVSALILVGVVAYFVITGRKKSSTKKGSKNNKKK